jgi:hypothetical protein
MRLSPVVNSQGQSVFVMGGKHAWKTFEHKGFQISLEWVGQGKRSAPCMCIWPVSNIFVAGSCDSGAWGISRRAITDFVGFNKDGKCTGSASIHCYRECHEALPILGKDKNDKQAFLALVDTVIKFAPELVRMPPTPQSIKKDLAGPAMWDVSATIKETGKTVSEASI